MGEPVLLANILTQEGNLGNRIVRQFILDTNDHL